MIFSVRASRAFGEPDSPEPVRIISATSALVNASSSVTPSKVALPVARRGREWVWWAAAMPDTATIERFHAIFRLSASEADALLGPGGYEYYAEYFTGLVPVESYLAKVRLMARLAHAADARVLDVGCGHGLVACLLAAYGAREVLGVELSAAKLEACSRVAAFMGVNNARFILTDGGRLPFGDNNLDAVCISAALSHVNDIDATLRDMRRVLRPGGRFYAFEDNNALWRRYRSVMEPRWRFAETGEGPPEMKAAQPDWIPYLERRQRMIHEWFPNLDEAQVREFARATQGLAGEEIRAAVSQHLAGSELIVVDKPFLCYAPDTGEAMEYPFTPPMLRDMVAQHFVNVRVHAALTGPWRGLKGAAKLALKAVGAVLPPVLYRLQPTFIVTGTKAAK